MNDDGFSGYSGYPQAPPMPPTHSGTVLSPDQFQNYLWGLRESKENLFYYNAILQSDAAQRARIEDLEKRLHDLTGSVQPVW